jgi:cytochrome c-type biogenesis protein CcmH/NrfG
VTESIVVTRACRASLRIAVGASFVACLIVGFGGTALAQKSPTAQAAFLRAQHDLVKEDVTDAAAEMETAVRFEPRFAFGWYLLASTSRRAGAYDRAVAAYRRYLELRPQEPDPLFGIGLCLEAIGDRDGAVAALKRYAELDTRPGSAEFVTQARRRVAVLQQPPTPEADSVPRVAPAPSASAGAGGAAPAPATADTRTSAPAEAAAVHASLAGKLVSEHKFNEAIEELRTAVKLAPAGAEAWYKLAFALRQAGQPAEAVKAYRRYITLRPDDPDTFYTLGQVLLASGRPDEALLTLRAYVKTERRKTESRWVAKARAEIAKLEAARQPAGPKEPKPLAESPPTKGSPAATQPPAAVEARQQ